MKALFIRGIIFVVVFCNTVVAAEIQVGDYCMKGKQFSIVNNKIIADKSFTITDQQNYFNYKGRKGFVQDNFFYLEDADIRFYKAKIQAKKIQGEQDKYYQGEKITATLCSTCNKGKQHKPLWQIRAEKLYTNLLNQETIQLQGVYIDILGKQIFKIPSLQIPAFWSKGKNGFLLPEIKYGATAGLQLTIPFYWMPYQNFDITFLPQISKEPIYNVKMRHKLSQGGYELSILTGKPHLKSIYKNQFWPTLIKGNGQIFTTYNQHCTNFTRGSELGFRGNIAFGNKAIFLKADNTHPYQAMVAEIYYNNITDRSLFEARLLQFQDKNSARKQLVTPQIDFTYLQPFFNHKATLIQTISTNSFQDTQSKIAKIDLLIENKLLIKKIIADNYFIYQPKLVAYFDQNTKVLDPRMTVEWHYKKFDAFMPQIALNLARYGSLLFYDPDQEEEIYTINNPFPANSRWSLFSKNLRSLDLQSKAYLDYGATLYNTSNSSISLIRRDYLDRNRSIKNNLFQNKSDNYALQFNLSNKNLLIQNKSWFTNDLKLSNNELYFRQAFSRFKAGFNYFFFDKEINFMNQKMENHLIKTSLQYHVTDEISLGLKNSFLLNDENNLNTINYKYNKFELKFQNDCAEIALAIKKYLTKNKAEEPESIYQIHFKIPELI